MPLETVKGVGLLAELLSARVVEVILPVPGIELLPIVEFVTGNGCVVDENGAPVVCPVPDSGSVELPPDGVPVSPVNALELDIGYGAELDIGVSVGDGTELEEDSICGDEIWGTPVGD